MSSKNNQNKVPAKRSTSSKQTTKKPAAKSAAAKKKTVKRASAKTRKQDFGSFHTEVEIWITIALALLLMLGNFGFCGTVGNFISSVFFGVFGVVQYVLPVVILILTGILLANEFSSLAIKKTILTIVFLCMCSAVFQMIVDFHATDIMTVVEHSFDAHVGGGFFGGIITIFLTKHLGEIGAALVVVFVMLISLILIFEKSVLNMLKEAGIHTAEVSKEKKEMRQIRRAEKESAAASMEIPAASKKEVFYDHVIKESNTDTSTKKTERKRRKKSIDLGERFGFDTQFEHGESINNADITDAPSKSDSVPSWLDRFDEMAPKDQISVEDKTQIPKVTEEITSQEREAEERVPADKGMKELKPARPAMDEAVSNQVKEDIEKAVEAEAKPYVFPPVSLLAKGDRLNLSKQQKILRETALKLQQTMDTFGVKVTVTDVTRGPSVTRYELQPEQGVKVSKVVGLEDDIKLNLAADDIRIEAPIPGKAAIGIEVPNKHNEMVRIRDLIESPEFRKSSSRLSYVVGKDIGGSIIIADIAKMPHMLIAGATGSGKSVFINTLIISILYKADPKDVKFIMIDPKVVELSTYNGIPHLLIPVVTDPQKAAGALNWAVAEMTDRYNKFAEYNVRNLEGYNKKVEEILATGEVGEEDLKKMPQIVIIVDELADLMMVAPGEVESAIVRLSQLARAAGIHLVIATQRPSVNVITGLIKANVPSRIAFAVSSGVDSRTILDSNGAEKLLGNGDMLFAPYGQKKAVRVQGAFVSDQEVGDIVDFLKENNQSDPKEDLSKEVNSKIENSIRTASLGEDKDDLFMEAAKFIVTKDKASIGMIQRMFKVGFNRAARIMEQLAEAGIVGPEEGTKPRKILMSEEQLEAYFEEYV